MPMELIALTAIFLTFIGVTQYLHQKERQSYMDQISDLEDKMIETSMARDLTEYASARRMTDPNITTTTDAPAEPEFIGEGDLDSETFLKMLEKKGAN